MIEYKSKYGLIKGITGGKYYPSGQLKECLLEEYNQINIDLGTFVPKYEIYDTRTKYRNALSFYESGELKSIFLEQQQEIISSLGELKVELITFYESGSIHRVFPLYGQISGYWSEEEELALAQPITIDLHSIKFDCKVSCFCFYPSGQLKSLTFCKDEKITVETNYGKIKVHLGISFYEDGKIKSLEPFNPVKITSSIGTYYAYDNAPFGIHGDNNSLCFTNEGVVQSFTSSLSGIEIKGQGIEEIITPTLVPSQIDLDEMEVAPIKFEFKKNKVMITDVNQVKHEYEIDKYQFSNVTPQIDMTKVCSGKCSGCNQCG